MLKLFKNAGIVLLVLLSITQLYDWYKKSQEGDLTATVSYGFVRLPDSLNREFEKTYHLCSKATLDSLMADYRSHFKDEKSRSVVDGATREVSYELQRRIQSRLPFEFSGLSGYWAVTIRNEGTKSLKDVVMTLPNTTRLSVHRQGEETSESSSGEVIRIGNLQPIEEINIFAWTNISPSRLYFDQVKLIHDAGVGEVTFLAPVGDLGQWVDSYSGAVMVGLITFAVASLSLYGLSFLEEKSKGSPSKPVEPDQTVSTHQDSDK